MSVNYNAPCRVTIFAEMPGGEIRTIRIPFTGYGADRHIKRWFNRDALRVTVNIYSRSSGRNIGTVIGERG